MCGICGIVALGRPAEAETAALMARELGHRGPDGSGSYAEEGVALAHRRLSIIDLPDAGVQPFPTETFFRDILRLPPAHSLVFDDRGLRLHRYWRLEPREAPPGDWLRGRLGELAADVFASRSFVDRGVVNASSARRRLERHRRGEISAGFELSRALNLELWARTFVDG